MDYKITLYGNRLYKEIKLQNEWQNGFKIGTAKECQIRFFKERFFTDFLIQISLQKGQWVLNCSDSVYLKKNGAFKEYVQYLTPGDRITVCHNRSDSVLFTLEFAIDFAEQNEDYNRKIFCADKNEWTIGGEEGCNICIRHPLLAGEVVCFKRKGDALEADVSRTTYGITVNGCRNPFGTVFIEDGSIFSINGFSFYLNKGYLYTSDSFQIVTDMPMETLYAQKNHLKYPKFVRSARQRYVIPEEKINILSPSAKPENRKKNLFASMAPMLASMLMMVLMRMAMGGNILFIFMCIGMGGVSVVMSVVNYRSDSREYKKNIVKRENDYNRYMNEQEEKILRLREKERRISRQKIPSIEQELKFVEDFDARLFEKLRTHEDFLWVRLGEGTVESQNQVEYKLPEFREADDPLMDYPELLHHKYQYIEQMPVVLELEKLNAVGFVGDRNKLYQMAKNLILHFCIEHYHQDVRLFMMMDEEDNPYFKWARWFENFTDEKSGIRQFMYDEDSRKRCLECLYSELSFREKEKNIKQLPYCIVMVYRSKYLAEHPVIRYVERASDLGFCFLFFEEYEEYLNQFCQKRVFLKQNQLAGYIQDIGDGEAIQEFHFSRVAKEKAEAAALKMACVYMDDVNLEASLTKNITLFQLFGIMNVYDLELGKRWGSSQIYKSMAAPLGVKSGDEIVYLDLHEKYHGPHGLVAGTTGSGKSEILQTYILSMATLFHPYEVGFIIIDFKGGGMVNQFRNLPHLNGAITNIDGNEINRSLSAIKAELQKRQRFFAEKEVNHIDDYIRLFKEGKAEIPLPHLILIVDEFAELKSEQPEFMKELISAARIGRSLGVHLILATQKPAGVVNDQIWSNSKFKLCLKVQNKADSNEVLKSPLAAEIREPGRAYLQVGNNEIFQLFQSAYSGAPIPNDTMSEQKKYRICRVELDGSRQIIYEQKPKESQSSVTQLDAIVAYIKEYCEQNKIQRLPNICLPSLKELISYGTYEYYNSSTDVCVPIGVYDDPSRQLQAVTDVDFSQNNLFIVGSSQFGKTNLLQVMLRGVAERYSSDEVHVYILDYASGILKNFEKLLHVGGVVTASEEDKLQNFVDMIQEELENRKRILSEMGLSSYAAYREGGFRELPQIIIMVDNFAALRENSGQQEASFLKFAREGSALGICMVCTAQQTGSLGFRYFSNFGKKIALYCNESGEYSSLFERCRKSLKGVPGRCLLSLDKEIFEGQVYLAFPAEREIERVNEIRTFIAERNAVNMGKPAKKIPVIPEKITEAYLKELIGAEWDVAYHIPLGVNYETMEVDNINMANFPILGVSGDKESGRLEYMKFFLRKILSQRVAAPVKLYIIDNEEGELEEFKNQNISYTTDCHAVKEILNEMNEVFQKRKEFVAIGKTENLSQEPLHILVINSVAAYKLISDEQKMLSQCIHMISESGDLKISLILSDLLNENIQFKAPELVKMLVNNKNLLIFRGIKKQKLVNFPAGIPKPYCSDLTFCDCFFICGDYVGKYKAPCAE